MASIKTIFTNIANAIRTKKGSSAKYLPENMAEEISTIETGITPSGKIEITNTEEINVTNYATAQIVDSNLSAENIKKDVSILGVTGTFEGGGDTTQEDRLITREITNYSNDRITKVGEGAFYYCKKLVNVSLPNVTSIDSYAFQYCYALTSVSLPNVTSISSYAFSGCSALTSVNIPNITSISSSVFKDCYNLTTVSFPQVTSIGGSGFYGCSNLTSVNIPNATSIGSYAFSGCSNLTSISLPNATSISSSVFSSCYSLLKLVITQTDSVCTLSNTNAFSSCYHFLGKVNSKYNPQGLKDGRIYVPDSLVDSYKEATNWSAYADIIVPLSTLIE